MAMLYSRGWTPRLACILRSCGVKLGALRHRVRIACTCKRNPKPRELTPTEKRVKQFLATTGGPVMTVALVLGIAAYLSLIVFGAAREGEGLALKLRGYVLGLAAVLACAACHLVDPGTPRPDPTDPGPADLHLDEEEESADPRRRTRERALPDGMQGAWTQKFCRECRLWRPYRCGHCHYCGRCALRLDHHCIFMGTCIGERNQRFFALFLLFAGLGLLQGVVLWLRCYLTLKCWADSGSWLQISWAADGAWLSAWVGSWTHTIILFHALGLTLAGGGTLAAIGVFYIVMSLVDIDVHQCRDLQGLRREMTKFWKCPGVSVYWLGPIALKRAVRPVQRLGF